ncbi:MAG: cytochrome c peroxidase [Motiliproteus sp.]
MMKNLLNSGPVLLSASIAVAMLASAGSASAAQTSAEVDPPLAPLGSIPVPIPTDNKQTPEKIELGKKLFFDPRLGGDASISCASCHDPDSGWGWSDAISRGYPGTVHWRNSQTVVNSAYYSKLFWAGSAKSLEAQAPSAAKGGVAGNGEVDIMEARMALIPEYRKRFNDVFGDSYPLIKNAWRAIAAFERTLVQTDTPLDKYLEGDKKALSKQQLSGMKLFNGKAGCIQCHNGALASDEKYYNIGVAPAERWEEDGLAQISYRFEMFAKGSSEELYRTSKADPGLYFRGKNKWDKGKFRTPSLRYTAYTAPYMHNGSFYTMEEVVDFYNAGGVHEDGRTTAYPKTKSKLIKPLGLSDQEKEDLVAFIEAFSGDQIEIDKPVLPEYAPLFTEAELKEAKK